MRTTLPVLALLALTACSSSSSTGSSGSSGTDDGCSITLSGAVAKTVACNASTGFTLNDNLGSLNLTTLNGQEATFTFTVKGEPQATTYTTANATLLGADVVEDSPPGTWTADSSKKIGTATLTITSITVSGTRNGDKLYIAHGTAKATLAPANTSTTGQVTFDATF